MSVRATAGESDALVIGAGPAGCAAGIVLAQRGFKVTVVDRAVFPRDKVCGDAISNDGIELLARLGADSLLRTAPQAVVARAAALFPDGTRIVREYERHGLIVPRLDLDDCLRRALEAAGGTLIQGQSIKRLMRDGDRFTGVEGEAFAHKAKLLVAADGYGSLAVGALGAAPPKGRLLAISATAYYKNVTFPHGADTADHYFERELPYGYGWIFPAVNGISNLGVYLRTDGYDQTGKKLKELLDGFLERHSERLRHAEIVGKMRVWSLPLAPNPMPITAPGLLVAGDAASLVDPLTGEGIWQGLHSGALAGETAAKALERGALDADLRREYEAMHAKDIGRPSRAKAWVQRAMLEIVNRRLYENPIVRAGLTWGYEHRALEMTKS